MFVHCWIRIDSVEVARMKHIVSFTHPFLEKFVLFLGMAASISGASRMPVRNLTIHSTSSQVKRLHCYLVCAYWWIIPFREKTIWGTGEISPIESQAICFAHVDISSRFYAWAIWVFSSTIVVSAHRERNATNFRILFSAQIERVIRSDRIF